MLREQPASPSPGRSASSDGETLLLGRFLCLAPGVFWHVSGLSEVFLKLFLFYCQNTPVSQRVSPQRGVKWRHDEFAHPAFSKKEEIWNKFFLSTSPSISGDF